MDRKHRLGCHGSMDDYTNADLRQILVRECFEPDCEKIITGRASRCDFHKVERRLLLHQVNRTIDIKQFKKSGIVQRLERINTGRRDHDQQ